MTSIRPKPALRLYRLPRAAWLAPVLGILALALGPAQAQQDLASERSVAAVQAPAPQPSSTPSARQIQIGQATTELLDLQRASRGQRPRPIEGEQASRSYLRYLKSFESTIPDHYGTGLNTGAGSR